MRTPEEIMQDLDRRVALIQEQAGRAEQLLAESQTTRVSDEGEVTVTVNAGGALTGLRFSTEARKMSANALADLVLHTYRLATEEAGRSTAAIMSDMLGGDSEAMSVLQSFTDAPRES